MKPLKDKVWELHNKESGHQFHHSDKDIKAACEWLKLRLKRRSYNGILIKSSVINLIERAFEDVYKK